MSLANFDTLLGFSALMLVLSLFVTACVQLLAGLLRLRHGNLVWGLERLLKQLDPDNKLGEQAKGLAQKLAGRVPALSGDSIIFGGGAQALTAGELVKALRAIGTAKSVDALGTAAKDWLDTVDKAAAPTDLVGKIDAISTELSTLFPAQAQAAREAVERAIKSRDELARQVGDWFDSAMDRTADRFALQTRYIAVVIAGMVVLFMGVDAPFAYQTLRQDASLRAAQLAAVQPTLTLATRVLDSHCKAVASAVLPGLAASAPAAAAEKLKAAPPHLDSAMDGRRWLADNKLTDQGPAFDEAYSQAAKTCVEEQFKVVDAMAQHDLKQVQVLTVQDKIWQAAPWAWQLHIQPTNALANHLPGLLLSWVLLTLGAPFWFNVLKNLSSLRPLIANKADKPVT